MKMTPDYTVLYSDDDLVALNKRAGLLVAADRYDADALRLDRSAEREFGRLFAVHRIDKDTSGCVLYARNAESHKVLSAQFAGREAQKIYHCLVHGCPTWRELSVNARLMPDGDARHRTVVNRTHGKPSETDFINLGKAGPFSWIEARPRTGRTHQIRAHLQAVGFSIVCDPLYGANQHPVFLSEIKRRWNGDESMERPLLSRLALHAFRLAVAHPGSGERMTFTAPYPKDLDATRKQLAAIFGVDPLSGPGAADGR